MYPDALVCKHLSSLRSNPPGSQDFIHALRSLDVISGELAREAGTREVIGRSSPDLWKLLDDIWKTLSARNVDILTNNSTQRDWTVCIARFTRNLVAENPQNQREAFKFEPAIRTVARAYTSHVLAVNEKESIATRFLMQTLSNIVTSNEELLQQIWATYMNLAEEKNILIRIMAHPDERTVAAALVLINNSLIGSRDRMSVLVNASSGRRLCVAILDRLSRYVETSDDEVNSDMFSLGWTLFKTLFDNGFGPPLLSITTMEGEVVNPHQTTLLKLLDSYLMQSSSASGSEGKNPDIQSGERAVFQRISEVLLTKFFELIHNAQSSISYSLGLANAAPDQNDTSNSRRSIQKSADGDAAAPLRSLDVLLPRVCEATVLVAQCFCTMALAEDAQGSLSENARHTRRSLTEASSQNGDGLVESLIELLRLLDAFLPRIMFGRASLGTARPDASVSAQIDKKEDRGFSYLKRDLVRLVGILCYENRAVQDRVRKCDGITVVMNLCVMDERNPYLREHALFALRNLLHNNVENQTVVNAMKPMGTWDENGVLRDVVGVRG